MICSVEIQTHLRARVPSQRPYGGDRKPLDLMLDGLRCEDQYNSKMTQRKRDNDLGSMPKFTLDMNSSFKSIRKAFDHVKSNALTASTLVKFPIFLE